MPRGAAALGGMGGFGGGAARPDMMMEEEKKEEELIDMSAFDTPSCVYCMAAITDGDQASGKVQMFLAEGCFH